MSLTFLNDVDKQVCSVANYGRGNDWLRLQACAAISRLVSTPVPVSSKAFGRLKILSNTPDM